MNIQNHKKDAQALADAVGREMFAKDRAAQALGIELVEIRPGYAVMSMTVRGHMLNGHDICHGGFTFTLADTAFAYACNSHNHSTVALSATITFSAPAQEGDILTAVAEERSRSGRTGVYDIAVADQNDKTIALFRGNSYRIKGEVVADLSELPLSAL